MTEIYLDETKLDFTDEDKKATVFDLINSLENELHKEKHLVAAVEMDGSLVPDWHSKEVADALLSEKKVIKIFTSAMNEFFLSSTEHAKGYMNVIKSNIADIVRLLRSGSEDHAHFMLSKTLDDIRQWIKTVDAINKGAMSDNITLFKQDPSKYYSRILKNMEEIKKAQENQDMVLLGDILEYEVMPLLEEIEKEMFGGSS